MYINEAEPCQPPSIYIFASLGTRTRTTEAPKLDAMALRPELMARVSRGHFLFGLLGGEGFGDLLSIGC